MFTAVASAVVMVTRSLFFLFAPECLCNSNEITPYKAINTHLRVEVLAISYCFLYSSINYKATIIVN